MKTPNYPYRCPLGRLQPQTSDLDAIKERGWRDQHILVVSESDERLDFVEREYREADWSAPVRYSPQAGRSS
jgi:hypothetical protein